MDPRMAFYNARYLEIKLGPVDNREYVSLTWSRWWNIYTFRTQDGRVLGRHWGRSLHQAMDRLRRKYNRKAP